MSKHRWRETLQSLCENHTDPEEDEQLKLSKIEIQNKVSKALKLVNDRRPPNRKNRNGEGNSRRESELCHIIEDFSRQYLLIYDLHVTLRTQLSQTYNDITEEGFYTASSDSASEATEDIFTPNGSQEVEDLKTKLCSHKIQELEKIVCLHENELEQLKRKLDDKEAEISELEAREKDASVLNKDLEAQVESLNHEKGRLIKQTKCESEAVKKMQMKESDLVMNLKKEMQDKEDELSALRPTVKGLESELNGLQGKLKELGEKLIRKDQQNSCFKDEVDSLQGKLNLEYQKRADNANNAEIQIGRMNTDMEILQERILELENQLEKQLLKTDQENNCFKDEVNALQVKVIRLNNIVVEMNTDKEIFQGRIFELEKQLEERGDESSYKSIQMEALNMKHNDEIKKLLELEMRLTQKEDEVAELTSTLMDREITLNQQEDTINRLKADCKIAKSRIVQASDKKIEEMASLCRKSMEANITILRQRIRVAEQVQSETKERFKNIKEEHSQVIARSKGEMNNFFNAVNHMLNGLQLFDERESDFSRRISRVLDEIRVMKNCIKVRGREMKPVKDKGVMISDEVMFENRVTELEKLAVDKEEQVMKIAEEKKEAIRQLCISVEYHQNRCVQLIKLLSKTRRGC